MRNSPAERDMSSKIAGQLLGARFTMNDNVGRISEGASWTDLAAVGKRHFSPLRQARQSRDDMSSRLEKQPSIRKGNKRTGTFFYTLSVSSITSTRPY